MAQIYGCIRTSRALQEGVPGMDPASQELQFRRAGVPLGHIFRDVGVSGTAGTQERRGWHRLNARLAGGDTLVVVAIDRIGRTWQDTVRSICALRDRGVNIRSLAEAEAQWTRYLEADEGSPEAFFGQVLVLFAAWVADQELQSVKRRTREGLERARQQGKLLGPPRKINPNQAETMRRMRQEGASLRRRPGLRVLPQHRTAGAAPGGSGGIRGYAPQRYPQRAGDHQSWRGRLQMELNPTELIGRAPWREAVTYRDTWPHEYVLSEGDKQQELLAAVCDRFRAGEGVACRFCTMNNTYLFIGDHKCWLMTHWEELEPGVNYVINRARLYRDRRDFVIQPGDSGKLEDYPVHPGRRNVGE